MKIKIHMNLINENEIKSSSQVRLQVMLPVLLCLVTISIIIAWIMLSMEVKSFKKQYSDYDANIASSKSAYEQVLSLKAIEEELNASDKQIQAFRTSQNKFAPMMLLIAQKVPSSIQFISFNIEPPSAPPPPKQTKGKKAAAKKVIPEEETVVLTIRGRVFQKNLDKLTTYKDSLLDEDMKPYISNAEIIASELEPTRNNTVDRSILFEIKCTCTPRRFK